MRRLKASIKICPLKECLIIILFSKEIKLLLSTLCVIPFFYTNVRVFFLPSKIENLADQYGQRTGLWETFLQILCSMRIRQNFFNRVRIRLQLVIVDFQSCWNFICNKYFLEILICQTDVKINFANFSINPTTKKYLVHFKAEVSG